MFKWIQNYFLKWIIALLPRPTSEHFPPHTASGNRIAYLISIKSLPTAEDIYNKYKPSKQYTDS